MSNSKWIGVAVLVIFMAASVYADDASQLLKKCKAATAIAVLPEDRGSGSAFCIDPVGVFITNAHVVKSLSPTEAITLVVNPGGNNEKVFRAKVIAADDNRDLALLQTTDGKDFTSLPLGADKDLYETQQLTAFGFPFGSALSVKNHQYPSITVNLVHISALRRSGDVLDAIQIDSQLNPGNSGGPVVDSAGNVMGIVSSGILGGGINFAIPVSILADFLKTPRIVFTPATMTKAQQAAGYDLTVNVIELEKDPQPLTVQVVLNPETSREQKIDATSVGAGQFKAHVQQNGENTADTLSVSISLPDGVIRSNIDDQTVKLDDQDFKLSEISNLERSVGKATVALRNGKEVSGTTLTIGAIKAMIGGQPVSIDGEKIDKIVIYAGDDENVQPRYKIIVKRGDKMVADQGGTFGETAASAPGSNPTTRDDDDILARLDDAKDQYQTSIDRAKQQLLDAIDKRSQTAANNGDLDAVKSMDAAKTSIDADGKLPEDMKDAVVVGAMNTYSSGVKQANARLAIAYQQAIRDYTRARKTDEAEAIKNEMAEKGIVNNGESAGTGSAGFLKLGGTSRLPFFLEPNPNAFSEGAGLQLNGDDMIRTRDGTWLNQDFTFDLIYSYKPGVQGIGVVGFGEGPGQQNVLFLRLHTPNLINGFVGMGGSGVQEAELTKVSNNGPHMLRIEKKGESITVSLCIDYKGTFTADATRSMNDIKTAAPYLNAKNTYLFFGRGGLIFQEVRLIHSASKAASN